HGIDRKDYLTKLADYDIVLTTYALIRRDLETLQEYRFHYIVLDEAQAIKNPKSLTTQGVCSLKSNHRLCLTGTPMENHLGELWSMYHFLMPGYLGPMDRFNRQFRKPIEKEADSARLQQLQKRIKPFLLRRTKQAVAQELPEKTEIIRSIILEGKQRDLYESIRLAMDQKVRDEIKKKGLARSHIMILDALLKLRQVCCDPRLVALDKAKKVKQSAKMDLLMEMLPEMIEEGRKILVFSQFTKMLAIIEDALKQQHITYSKLTGQTRKRDEAIDFFQDGPATVMLISLKAGGVGLNLTAADVVIHYDPWWNPAVENQATDRAHRIGQDKAVFVYKLISENTVEDKIIALQQKKQALADNVYGGKGKAQQGPLLSAEDLEDLLKPIQ
ncbi:MAG: DEAD/DEAH box helicase, partial [Methylococcales bacterium]